MKKLLLYISMFFVSLGVYAEDGSQLWLRYDYIGTADVVSSVHTPVIDVAIKELHDYWKGEKVKLTVNDADERFKQGGNSSYVIHRTADGIEIVGSTETSVLYGAYDLLRQQKTGIWTLGKVMSSPFSLRMLNHWDNINGSIERGYAGKSLWKWEQINENMAKENEALYCRIIEYCRANASLGINGSVLNNVNASPNILTRPYLEKVKVLADVFRPYGIRVYLSINFASPMALGATKTADPLNKKVQRWWVKKAAEIYSLIPDFGGFLVKANSEGQPGPGDYGRTHADGANILADALAPYKGTVIWRSFVYGANHKGEDRVKQAVSEFKPMDGQFRENVILQSKNGPLDFQPREPYAPIFDNITQTPQMAELQITQEYLGQSIHLVYLSPMWKEFFSYVSPNKLMGIAGVANIGDDVDWCGHHFSQANWYAFGRLAWNPELTSEEIAEEWLVQTFTDRYAFVKVMRDLMMRSREACVDYMMPLGLHHIFSFDHHYGPEPDGFIRTYPLEWCPVYYHKADKNGIGFDRTTAGSGATTQYREPYSNIYNKVETCPENLLLWFHHLPWNYKMKNGRTLWENLQERYNAGVREVMTYRPIWKMMRPYVDEQRWQEVDARLKLQEANAKEWRDVCLKYFGSFVN
ncbi:MAG: alpha-glucuronidase [Prevotella sp.]|nr:alpha-glucuronidase [Prevotella sp.]